MSIFLNLGVFPFITTKLLLICTPVLIFLVFHNRYSRLLHIHVKRAVRPGLSLPVMLIRTSSRIVKGSKSSSETAQPHKRIGCVSRKL